MIYGNTDSEFMVNYHNISTERLFTNNIERERVGITNVWNEITIEVRNNRQCPSSCPGYAKCNQ